MKADPTIIDASKQLKFLWIRRLRQLAVCFQLILLVPGVQVGYLEQKFIPLYLGVNFLLLISTFLKINKLIPYSLSLTINLIFDIFIFTIMISISGKMENPFWQLIYIHAGIAAILLERGQSKFYLPFLFGAMAYVHITSYSYHSALLYTIIPQWIILVFAWFFTRLIGYSLAKQAKQIQVLKEKEMIYQKQKWVGSLSAGFLHELSTPLNTVRLKVDKLLKIYSESTQVEVLDKALTQCEEIVSNLNIAQHEIDHKNQERSDINEIIKDVAGRFRYDNASIEIELKLRGEIYASISRVRFSWVLKVILNNAIEANAKTVMINAYVEDDSVYIVVNDDGHGFSEFILNEFGTPYVSTKGRGRGLGLFSSLLSIESMGGHLTIANRSEGGGEVRMSLPKE